MKYLISAGHGGGDPGACANGRREADIALDMRDLTATALMEMRHAVSTDGGRGENLPLKQALALVRGHDLAVELHCNASVSILASGVEVISSPGQKPIAQRIARSIAMVTGQRLRGEAGWIDVSQSAHSRLAFVQAGGLIVEMVFISNVSDTTHFLSLKDKVAQAIAGAICAYEVAS